MERPTILLISKNIKPIAILPVLEVDSFNKLKLDADIIDAATGLQLPQKLGEQAYTVPINGMYTTKVIADGLRRGAANLAVSLLSLTPAPFDIDAFNAMSV